MSKIEKFPRLPETGEGNKTIDIVEVAKGRVTMRVMSEVITYGIMTVNNKIKCIEISRQSEAQVYDPSARRQYPKLENEARRQAYAILNKQATEEKSETKDGQDRNKSISSRQKNLF